MIAWQQDLIPQQYQAAFSIYQLLIQSESWH
jgi:hypothetical protein